MMQANLKAGCRPDGTGCPQGVTGQSIPLVTSGGLPASFVNSNTTISDLNQNAAGNFAGRIEQTTLAVHLRPNPQFGSIMVTSNAADSVYHSMQATLRKRFGRGLLFNAAYTFLRSSTTTRLISVQPSLLLPRRSSTATTGGQSVRGRTSTGSTFLSRPGFTSFLSAKGRDG